MSIAAYPIIDRVPEFAGLRMTAEEFFSLPDDGCDYELVNGVLLLSPSPRPQHQRVLAELIRQLASFLLDHPVGVAYPETDVKFATDFVYRPELIFLRSGRVVGDPDHIRSAPDLVVEVVSPAQRRFDYETKRDDYERFGVFEYWLIDPQRDTMTFLRLTEGRYVEVAPGGNTFTSEAVPGFTLDLAAVRKAWQPI